MEEKYVVPLFIDWMAPQLRKWCGLPWLCSLTVPWALFYSVVKILTVSPSSLCITEFSFFSFYVWSLSWLYLKGPDMRKNEKTWEDILSVAHALMTTFNPLPPTSALHFCCMDWCLLAFYRFPCGRKWYLSGERLPWRERKRSWELEAGMEWPPAWCHGVHHAVVQGGRKELDMT